MTHRKRTGDWRYKCLSCLLLLRIAIMSTHALRHCSTYFLCKTKMTDGCFVDFCHLHPQFLWQQSAASDCNQERQHTLANRCSLSSAVSSAAHILFFSKAFLAVLRTGIIGVLSTMHTAGADRKELSAKKALCTSRLATI